VAATDTGPLSAPEGRSASSVLEDAGKAVSGENGVALARSLETQLLAAGLKPLGPCDKLSSYGEDLLRTSPMLQDMTAAEVDILGDAMVLIRAEPGQLLIREGEAGDWMMILLKGTVDVSKRVEPRREDPPGAPATNGADEKNPDATVAREKVKAKPEVTMSRIAVIQRGAAVGDMSMLDSEPRYASCTAIEAVEAGVLDRHAVAVLIRDHPVVGAKVLVKITQLMAQRLRNTSNQLVKLLQKE
jgi:CRP/FNR family cyclic AMP-dependent transcriptional regulator